MSGTQPFSLPRVSIVVFLPKELMLPPTPVSAIWRLYPFCYHRNTRVFLTLSFVMHFDLSGALHYRAISNDLFWTMEFWVLGVLVGTCPGVVPPSDEYLPLGVVGIGVFTQHRRLFGYCLDNTTTAAAAAAAA